MDRLSIPYRLAGAFGLIGVLIVVMAALFLYELRLLSEAFTSMRAGSDSARLVAEIQEDIGEARMHAFAYRATGDLNQVAEVRQNLDEARTVAQALRTDNPAMAEHVRAIVRLIGDYAESVDAMVAGDLDASARLDAVGPELGSAVEAKYDALAREAAVLEAGFLSSAASAWRLVIVISAAVVLLAAVLAILIVRSLTGPLGRLVSRVKGLAEGDYHTPVPGVVLRDELGLLARAQETLRGRLADGEALEREAEARRADERRRAEALDALIAEFESKADAAVKGLAGSAEALRAAARQLSAVTADAEQGAAGLAGAAEESSASVQTVASSAEELAASIGEILRAARETADGVGVAGETARRSRGELDAMAQAVSGM